MKRLALNGKKLISTAIAAGRVNSLHQASQKAGISYPTAFSWNKEPSPESPEKVSLVTLSRFIFDGLGYTPEDIENMKVGELFTLVDNGTVGGQEGEKNDQ